MSEQLDKLKARHFDLQRIMEAAAREAQAVRQEIAKLEAQPAPESEVTAMARAKKGKRGGGKGC